MPGMNNGLDPSDPSVIAAFRAAVLHQGIIAMLIFAMLIFAVLSVAWVSVRASRTAHPGPHGAGRARAPGHPDRAAARQPHPPAPRPGGLRPRGFRIDFDRQEVTCPQGQVSQGWHGPYPTSSPDAGPLIVARFTKAQCQPCPARAACTTSGDGKRTVGSPARALRAAAP
jgi:hypothetical protein